jgi:hypothetical protein
MKYLKECNSTYSRDVCTPMFLASTIYNRQAKASDQAPKNDCIKKYVTYIQ